MGMRIALSLAATDHDELCLGWSWEIEDEDELVARVTLGQYRHSLRSYKDGPPRPPYDDARCGRA